MIRKDILDLPMIQKKICFYMKSMHGGPTYEILGDGEMFIFFYKTGTL